MKVKNLDSCYLCGGRITNKESNGAKRKGKEWMAYHFKCEYEERRGINSESKNSF